MTRLIPLLLLSLTLIACRGGGLPGEPGPPVEEVYARIGDALIAGGDVAVVTEGPRENDFLAPRGTTRIVWLDVRGDRARIETRRTDETFRRETRQIDIFAYGLRHVGYEPNASPRPVERCPGVPAILTVYTTCPAPDDLTTVARQSVRFDGQPAFVLATSGKYSGIDSVGKVDQQLFVNAETYLPIARIIKSNGVDYEIRFTHSFVDRSTLPDDWFDPSAALSETIQLPISPP